METIDAVFAELEREARAIGRAREVEFAFERFYVSRAAPTDPRLRDIVEQSAAGLTLTTQRMPSGAGHDAQSVAQFAPVGMIFVPSRGGISHSPREYTSPEHVIHGANVLLRATMLADARNW
jgi:N-carbamoyl-L-amino-acid hydrolase